MVVVVATVAVAVVVVGSLLPTRHPLAVVAGEAKTAGTCPGLRCDLLAFLALASACCVLRVASVSVCCAVVRFWIRISRGLQRD